MPDEHHLDSVDGSRLESDAGVPRVSALKPREARLRANSLRAIGNATRELCGSYYLWMPFEAIVHNRSKTALARVRAAKAHLLKAEAALRKWAGR